MKTRRSKLVRFPSVLMRLGKRLRRVGYSGMLVAAVFAAPLQGQTVFNATADFSITNGNPQYPHNIPVEKVVIQGVFKALIRRVS